MKVEVADHKSKSDKTTSRLVQQYGDQLGPLVAWGKSVWDSIPNQQFVLGCVAGLLLGMAIMYATTYVQLEQCKVEMLRVQVSHRRTQIPQEKDAARCEAQIQGRVDTAKAVEYDLREDIKKLKQQVLKYNISAVEATQRCRLCKSNEEAVAAALAEAEAVYQSKANETRFELEKLKHEKTLWEAEKLDIKTDIQGQVDEMVKRAQAQTLRDAENKRRELDLQLHDENMQHLANAEKAQRAAELAKTERDQALLDATAALDKHQKLEEECSGIKAGHTQDMSKIVGELEAMSTAVAECQKTFTETENSMCAMCSHCANVHFPICKRCVH